MFILSLSYGKMEIRGDPMIRKLCIFSLITVIFVIILNLSQLLSHEQQDVKASEHAVQSQTVLVKKMSLTSETSVNVKDFGAKGDGKKDDTS